MIAGAPSCPPYRVLGLLGSGATADVYEVEHGVLGTRHALKVLAVPHAALVSRLLREARVQAAVHHPNVLPVLDVIDCEGAPGLVLPKVDGPTLQGLLAARRLATDEALALFHGVVSGVAALHAAGFVHRDLKPANVLLDCAGPSVVARVADLGLARSLDESGTRLTRAGQAVGTPAYAAPEQVAGDGVGPAADVWALGGLLAEMITGARPPRLGPVALSADAPPWLVDLVRSARDPDPERRPADGGAVLARLPAVEPVPSSRVGHRPAATPSAARLPTDPPGLVGRDTEVAAVADALQRPGLLSVHGPPGVGKSRVVLRAATQAEWLGAERSWVDLSGAETLDDALARVSALVDTPGTAPASVRIGRALAARDATLLVLDGTDIVHAEIGAVAESWCEAAPELRVIVVARAVFGRARAVGVGPLPAAAATQLLFDRIRAVRPGWAPSEADWQVLPGLVAELDGSPLALTLAASRLSTMSVPELSARLNQRFRLLVGPGGSLEASLTASWVLLGEAERSVLAQLSVFTAPLDVHDALAVVTLGPDDPPPLAVLGRLVERSMVERASEERMALSAAVRVYASTRPETAEVRRGAELRHGQWFARLGDADALDGLRNRGGPNLRATWTRAVPDLVAAHSRALARGDLDVERATTLALLAAQPHAPTTRAEALLDRGGRREHELRAELAVAWVTTGRAIAAEAVLRAGPADGPPRERLRTALALAQVLRETGREVAALAELERAFSAHRDNLDPASHARLSGMRGVIRFTQGDYDAAEVELAEALEITRRAGLVTLEGRLLGNLGTLNHRRGRSALATDLHQQAVGLLRAAGDRRSEAIQLANLGVILRQAGRRDEAARHLHEAAAMRREIGDLRGEAHVTTSLALIAVAEGRQQAAVDHMTRARHLAQVGGFPLELGAAMANRGAATLALGRLDDAESQLRDGLARLEAVGDRWHAAHAHVALGDLAHVRGDPDAARAHLDRALVLARETHFVRAEAHALEVLGRVWCDVDRPDDATVAWQAAIDLCVRSGDTESEHGPASSLARLRGDRTALRRRRDGLQDGVPRALVALAALSADVEHGEPEPQARAELSRAMDTLRERPLDLVRACVVGAALAAAEGDADGATRWRDRARAGADAMGLPAGSPLRRGT